MQKVIRLSIIISMLFLSFACSTKKTAAPAPAPPTDTVADVAPTPVEQPSDFVQPPAEEDVLPSDIAEVNRMAQARGWIRDVFFEFDQWALSDAAQSDLSASAKWLKEKGQYNLLIEGHCDERGTEQYNLALGDRRANIVKDYLVQLGVDASRIRTVSYGEERPFDEGHSESAWAQNRRGHLVIIAK